MSARRQTVPSDTRTLVRWKIVSLEPWQGGRGIVVPSYFTPEQIAEAVRDEDEERSGGR